MAQTHTSAPLVRTPPQTAVTEYGIFWELWPQFVGTGSERQSVGLEVELIGSHTMDANHLDPTCPMCRRVRYVLLAIASLLVQQALSNSRALICDIDSHANTVLCLPALGNRSLVSVGVNVSWSTTNRASETTVLRSRLSWRNGEFLSASGYVSAKKLCRTNAP